MKKTTYKCNLCLEEKNIDELLCLFYNSSRSPQAYTLESNLDLSDKHICKKCCFTVVNSFELNELR